MSHDLWQVRKIKSKNKVPVLWFAPYPESESLHPHPSGFNRWSAYNLNMSVFPLLVISLTRTIKNKLMLFTRIQKYICHKFVVSL